MDDRTALDNSPARGELMRKISSNPDDLFDDLLDFFEIPSMELHDLVLVLNVLRSEWVQRISCSSGSSFRIHTRGNSTAQDVHLVRQFLEYLMNSPILVKKGVDFIDFAKI